MNSQQHNHSNFWFNFSLGAVVGAAGVYFFGTKKGRKQLERALELTDNLEGTIEQAMGGVGKEYIEELARSASSQTVETGTVTQNKESFFQFLIKSIAEYMRKSHTPEHNFTIKDGRVVH